MEYGEDSSELTSRNWSMAFCGRSLDARSLKAIEYLNNKTEALLNFHYDAETFQFFLNNQSNIYYRRDEFNRLLLFYNFPISFFASTNTTQ